MASDQRWVSADGSALGDAGAGTADPVCDEVALASLRR